MRNDLPALARGCGSHFKTSTHKGGDLEQFLDNEFTRHREQLERYARIWKKIEQRLVRLGLYWPLLDGWREWMPP